MSVYRMFDILQDLVLVIDAERNLHYGNNTAANLFQVSNKRLSSGKPLSQFMEFKPDLMEDGQTIESIQESTQYREVEFTSSAGVSGWVQVSLQAVPAEIIGSTNSADRRWIVFFRDVSLEKVLAAKYKAELDQKQAVIEDLKQARAQLEDYSKNLEKIVAERTAELREANVLMTAVLNSLSQGISVFDRTGKALPIFSKVCLDILESAPGGRSVKDVLHLKPDEATSFDQWLEALYAEMLPFEDLSGLGPAQYEHSGGRHISLSYNPMRSESGTLEAVVMVATDRTNEIRALAEAERERTMAKMILQIATHRQQFRIFATEARDLLQLLSQSMQHPQLSFEELARWLHTIKGGSASFGLTLLAEKAHHCENKLIELKSSQLNEISAQERRALEQQVLEMQTELNRFLEANQALFGGLKSDTSRHVEISVRTLNDWRKAMLTSPRLQTTADFIFDRYLLEPIEKMFQHVDGMLADLASQLGKKIHPVRFVGGDLRVLPEPYTELFSNFVHIFRNGIDHGLEKPDLRLQCGKSAEGQIEVRFSRLAQNLKIEICDDGAGIDPERIRQKIQEKPSMVSWQKKSDAEIIQAIFADDFSTATNVTSISGRGVGLSAVLVSAEKLGGNAFVESTKGMGTRFVIEVPWIELMDERCPVIKAA